MKFNESEGIINKQKTETKGHESQKEEPTTPPIISTAKAPATTSEKKTENASQARCYSKYVVWPFVTIYRFIQKCFLLADRHNSGITALATIVIAVLTFYYVHYSKKQWQIMQRQLNMSMESQRARLIINDFSPTIEDATGSMAIITGNITITNAGPTVASEILEIHAYWTGQVHPKAFENLIPIPVKNGPSLEQGKSRDYLIETEEEVWDEVVQGKSFFSIPVAVSYRDIFGNAEIISDCFMYDHRMKRFSHCPVNIPNLGFISSDDLKKK